MFKKPQGNQPHNMAARIRKVALTDDWKANIQATQIMNRLYGHALGNTPMEKTQIDAAKVILAKILPDLKSIDNHHSGTIGVTQALQELDGSV